jgi:hypothetical protein
MRPRQRPTATWLGRLLRGWRPDRNPLRRRLDRFETAVLAILLAALLAGAPFVAHAAGNWTYATSVREQQAQGAALRQVPATLLQAAPSWSGYASMAGAAPEVKVRWQAPGGQAHTGMIYVLGSAPAGTTVMVWIDRAGQLTNPPLQSSQVAALADLDATLAVAVLAVALIAIGLLTHWVLNRRRLAAWDADWLATGPRWSQRR